MLPKDVEHHFDVDDRLLDVAIDHAHEVQRLIELKHHQVDQHEIADRVAAGADADDAHHNHDDGPVVKITAWPALSTASDT